MIDPRLQGRRRTGPDRKLSHDQELELGEAYARGDKVADIAQEFGLSKSGVYDVLDRLGIPRATTLRHMNALGSDQREGKAPDDKGAAEILHDAEGGAA